MNITATFSHTSPSLFHLSSPSTNSPNNQLVPGTPPITISTVIQSNNNSTPNSTPIARVPDIEGNSLLRQILNVPPEKRHTPMSNKRLCRVPWLMSSNIRLCRVPTCPTPPPSGVDTPEQVVPISTEYSPVASCTGQPRKKTLPPTLKKETKVLDLFNDSEIFASSKEE